MNKLGLLLQCPFSFGLDLSPHLLPIKALHLVRSIISMEVSINTIITYGKLDLMIATTALPIGISNSYHAIRMALQESPVIFKLNLMQALLLLFNGIVAISDFFKPTRNCNTLAYIYLTNAYLSILSINIILFYKAYYTTKASRMMGCLCILIQIAETVCLVQVLLKSQFIDGLIGGCILSYPIYWTMGLTGSVTSIMIILTLLFIISIRRHSEFRKLGLYSSLLQEGIVFFLIILIMDLTLAVLVLVQDVYCGNVLHLGWIVKSKLMTELMLRAHRRRKERRRSRGRQHKDQELTDISLVSVSSPSTQN
ncbi:hypothetical protein K493DRAFT_389958 [Basidiobolus meristosporus CBS 931.73]|uniref:Uncharacterized protein n=1 Tax=Basidiobolus meristosporus CBS 931.73 TaxID=1314790 RepID=A0A1Y1X486_9FUNG|nr:hypothetical protein K493DRAFT_389958 [Basidiobolus meristosporus CBS 931.73]|eukprot:ORX80465.1 hypothetical protein K493DRAFT_389958 [Basidiobolus meristosporus CBS 931.73]